MVAPLLCGAVIPGIGVLTAALLHKLWSLGDQLGPAEPVPAAPLHWQLEPPFLLLGLIILLDFIQKMLCRFKVPSSHAVLTCRPHVHETSNPGTFACGCAGGCQNNPHPRCAEPRAGEDSG